MDYMEQVRPSLGDVKLLFALLTQDGAGVLDQRTKDTGGNDAERSGATPGHGGGGGGALTESTQLAADQRVKDTCNDAERSGGPGATPGHQAQLRPLPRALVALILDYAGYFAYDATLVIRDTLAKRGNSCCVKYLSFNVADAVPSGCLMGDGATRVVEIKTSVVSKAIGGIYRGRRTKHARGNTWGTLSLDYDPRRHGPDLRQHLDARGEEVFRNTKRRKVERQDATFGAGHPLVKQLNALLRAAAERKRRRRALGDDDGDSEEIECALWQRTQFIGVESHIESAEVSLSWRIG